MSLYSQEKARNLEAQQFLDDLTADVAKGAGDGTLEKQFKGTYPEGYTQPETNGEEVRTVGQLITAFATSSVEVGTILAMDEVKLKG